MASAYSSVLFVAVTVAALHFIKHQPRHHEHTQTEDDRQHDIAQAQQAACMCIVKL